MIHYGTSVTRWRGIIGACEQVTRSRSLLLGPTRGVAAWFRRSNPIVSSRDSGFHILPITVPPRLRRNDSSKVQVVVKEQSQAWFAIFRHRLGCVPRTWGYFLEKSVELSADMD
jgi:hypothetical protein